MSLIVNLDSSRSRVVSSGRMVVAGGMPVNIYSASVG